MRETAKYALWLLTLLPLVQGCDHKDQPIAQTQALAPPIVDPPPAKPAADATANLPPPVIGTAVPPPEQVAQKPVEPPKKPVKKPKKQAPVTAPVVAAPEKEKETASAAPTGTPSVSAIGTLSSGASGNAKSQAEDSINSTEKGVNGITRPLSDAESKTAAQIREFLKQAREALTSGDTDGAQTLAKKAQVLLSELNQ
jgi:hypothetical protein